LNFFIIQAEKNIRGRSNKRPRANSSVLSPFNADFNAQSTNSLRKKTRKTSQLPQFRVYYDKTSTADTHKYFGQNASTPVEIKLKLGKIYSNISVKIPFRSEFRLISAISDPKKRSR
jgi:hypothetical protein